MRQLGLKGLSIALVALLWSVMALSQPRILAIGDSLTEGYGVSKDEAYPALVEKKLRGDGFPKALVVNAGTSGATSAFAERTLDFHLKRKKPDLLVLALGANDALRGLDPKATESNLDKTIKKALDKGVKVILAGMKVPPNYGRTFPKEFEEIFPRLAEKHKIPLIPFLLEGVAGERRFNLPDGIHPNPKGYELVSEIVYKAVKAEL